MMEASPGRSQLLRVDRDNPHSTAGAPRRTLQAHSFDPALLSRLALAYTVALACVLFWLFRSRGFDDPYITYRYAANLARGYGFVYNQGERVLSTTTPLYALLLVPAHLLGLSVPLVSNAIGCASLALGAWALWQIARECGLAAAGLVSLVLYPAFPLLILTLGAETALSITVVLLGCLAYLRERYLVAAVLLAIATLIRADGVLAGVVLAAHYLGTRRGSIPWRAVALYTVTVAPWFLFAWLYFGAPFPVTLFVKQQQARMANGETFLEGFLPTLRGYLAHPLFRLQYLVATVGLGYALVRRRGWLLVPGWSALFFLAYSVLAVSRYFWYYAPLVPGFVALVGAGTAAVHGLAGRLAGRGIAVAASLVLVIAIAIPQLRSLQRMLDDNDRRLAIYRTVGGWLAENTPADASIGILETGIVGYYADRRMIDFAGLLQPQTAAHFPAATSYEDAALWATARFRPDYLVLPRGGFPRLEQDPGILDRCRSVKTFADPTFASTLVVYECKK